ncbi:hypothetical protein BH23BAC4_BH23BAC4_00750 [soil metagenome]
MSRNKKPSKKRDKAPRASRGAAAEGKSPTSGNGDALALSRKTRSMFWVVLVAIPVAFFALVEIGLRVGGYGADTALFIQTESNGRHYYTVNPGVAQRYFSDSEFRTYVSRDRFLVDKPPDIYRIFALGASTTIGFPYMFNGSFSSLLRDRLYTQFPDRQVEIVNVGITAVNSYTVAEVAREVLDHQPDLILIYAGHNEFYGALGVGSTESVGNARWMIKAYLAAQNSRLFLLLRSGIRSVARTLAPPPSGDDAQLMERMARDRAIAIGSPQYERALRYFRANYEEAIDAVQRRGVDVVVSTLASNLRDQPPFVALSNESLSAADRERWGGFLAAAEVAQDANDHSMASRLLREALEIDSLHAGARFRLARSLEAIGQVNAARREYERARDLDGLRFRASSDFNEVVRSLAADREVPLVEMEREFSEASANGIPGSVLFWEHVHPTLDGYLLMAEAFANCMERHGLFASPQQWAAAPSPSQEVLARIAGVTDLDHEIASLRIAILTRRWPFVAEAGEFRFEPQSPAQEVAWAYVRGTVGWAAAHNELSRRHAQEGNREAAADEFWAVAKATSYDPHYAITAADMDAAGGRFEIAAERYAFALHIRDEALTRAKLGISLFESGRVEESIAQLDRAVSGGGAQGLSTPQRAHAHYLLGLAHLSQGDVALASQQADLLGAIAPATQPALQLAATVAAAAETGRVTIRRAESGDPEAP